MTTSKLFDAYDYQQDPDSNLKLLGHRYYDPSTGRFLTRDPIKDGRNWYSYCANNPVSNVDTTGLFEVIISIGVGLKLPPALGGSANIGFGVDFGNREWVVMDGTTSAGFEAGKMGGGPQGSITVSPGKKNKGGVENWYAGTSSSSWKTDIGFSGEFEEDGTWAAGWSGEIDSGYQKKRGRRLEVPLDDVVKAIQDIVQGIVEYAEDMADRFGSSPNPQSWLFMEWAELVFRD